MLGKYTRIYHVAMETAGGISLIYTSSKFNMIYLYLQLVLSVRTFVRS